MSVADRLNFYTLAGRTPLFEALTLIQTEKIRRFPVILFGSDYWQGMLQWLKECVLSEGKIDAQDMTLLSVTDSPEEACRILVDAYQNA